MYNTKIIDVSSNVPDGPCVIYKPSNDDWHSTNEWNEQSDGVDRMVRIIRAYGRNTSDKDSRPFPFDVIMQTTMISYQYGGGETGTVSIRNVKSRLFYYEKPLNDYDSRFLFEEYVYTILE